MYGVEQNPDEVLILDLEDAIKILNQEEEEEEEETIPPGPAAKATKIPKKQKSKIPEAKAEVEVEDDDMTMSSDDEADVDALAQAAEAKLAFKAKLALMAAGADDPPGAPSLAALKEGQSTIAGVLLEMAESIGILQRSIAALGSAMPPAEKPKNPKVIIIKFLPISQEEMKGQLQESVSALLKVLGCTHLG